jgi:hypothetical protein
VISQPSTTDYTTMFWLGCFAVRRLFGLGRIEIPGKRAPAAVATGRTLGA